MALYEHIFAARQDITAQQVETLTENFKKIITDNGGSVPKTEPWGIKNLSFKIKKNRKAHFVLLNIDAPAAAVLEMERQQRLDEDVIRILTIKVDELEEGPSAMMQARSSRDDRGPRRDGDRRPPRDGDRPRRDDAPAAPAAAAPAAPAADAKPDAEPAAAPASTPASE